MYPNGASHLLLTTEQLAIAFGQLRGDPKRPASFASLSPVLFESAEALEKKIKQLQKENSKRRKLDSLNQQEQSYGPKSGFEFSR